MTENEVKLTSRLDESTAIILELLPMAEQCPDDYYGRYPNAMTIARAEAYLKQHGIIDK